MAGRLVWIALRVGNLSPAEKLVLIAFADAADRAGRAWPSVDRVSDLVGVDRRTVQRAIAVLIRRRLLVRDGPANGGRAKSVRYLVALDGPDKGRQGAAVSDGDNGENRIPQRAARRRGLDPERAATNRGLLPPDPKGYKGEPDSHFSTMRSGPRTNTTEFLADVLKRLAS